MPQFMPPPKVMKERKIGLYNPNAYVRGSAVEALGKVYGVNAVEKARKEDSEARARVDRYALAGANVPYAPVTLTSEELASHSEFTVDSDYEEEKEEEPAPVGGEPIGPGEEQPNEPVPVAGAGVAATATAEEATGDNPVEKEKLKKKKKQAKPAPVGTAWFLKRGKELDGKRTC